MSCVLPCIRAADLAVRSSWPSGRLVQPPRIEAMREVHAGRVRFARAAEARAANWGGKRVGKEFAKGRCCARQRLPRTAAEEFRRHEHEMRVRVVGVACDKTIRRLGYGPAAGFVTANSSNCGVHAASAFDRLGSASCTSIPAAAGKLKRPERRLQGVRDRRLARHRPTSVRLLGSIGT